MNNENNIQNQNNNSVNNNQVPTLEMFDFGAPVNQQNNDLFEVPSSQQNMATPTKQTEVPTEKVEEVFEVPSAPILPEQIQNVELQNEIPANPQMEVIETAPEIAMPTMQTEQIVLDNEKKKQSSDLIILIIVVIMVIGVFYIDNIIAFVENNIIQTPPTGVVEAGTDNLYEGYIKVNEEESSITLDKLVRFYNFKKDNENHTIRFNYKTLKDVKDITEKGYYVEFYDVEKRVLYKELLTKNEKHTQDSTYIYDIILDINVFEDVTYALVKKYNENELNNESTLNCIYKVSNSGYNELYKHNFKFKNDMLISYDVDKYIQLIDANNASAKKATIAIQDEYDKLVNLELPATYEDNKLVYSINLENVTSSYIPLYKKGTTSRVIEKREEYLKWECE